jgi:SAM-dependent methyltransferase
MTTDAIWILDRVPVLQNRVYDSKAAAKRCAMGSVRLVQDLSTGLVHNCAFDPDLIVYDDHYQNEQAHSPAFREHLEHMAAKVLGVAGRRAKLVEVGCGKGFFLRELQRAGADIRGFDPAYEGDDLSVEKRLFDGECEIRADVVILRHTLEHVQRPHEFLRQIAEANGGQGRIVIEVPCFDWIVDNRAFYDVFYEHCNYFTIDSLTASFGDADAGHCFGGQYLYVVADLATLRPAPVYHGARYGRLAELDELLARLVERVGPNQKNIVWGAGAKGVTFAWWIALKNRQLDYVVDINPKKQGRYLAGSGVQVISPAQAEAQVEPGDLVFIMNPAYSREIRSSFHGEVEYVEVA